MQINFNEHPKHVLSIEILATWNIYNLSYETMTYLYAK